MFSFDEFVKVRPEKVFIFGILGVIASGLVLLFFPSEILHFYLLALLFFGSAVFLGYIANSIAWVLLYPFCVFLLTQILDFSGIEKIVAFLLCLGSMVTAGTLMQMTKNSVSIRFFQTSSKAISSGLSFFIIASIIQMTTTLEPQDLFQKYVVESDFLKTSINQVSSVSPGDIDETMENFFLAQVVPRIELICEGNAQCIETQTQEMQKEIQGKLSSADMLAENPQISGGITNMVESRIASYLEPEKLEELVKKVPYPIFHSLSGEILQRIAIVFFFFMLFLPFSFFITWAIAIGLVPLFFTLIALHILKLNTKTVQKEIMY